MLRLDAVRKTFNPGTANEVRALGGVSLEIAEGSFTVVIGTNGSGKSTLQGAISGAFPLDGGRISVAGRDITEWPEHRRAHLVGRVFQDPFAGTAPELTVAENLALASKRGRMRSLAPLMLGANRSHWRDLLAQIGLGLESRLDDPIGLLSGGQRQSITLLLLLLDEHTAALDPKSADQVITLSDEVIRRDGLTTLMVTHSMAQAVAYGDRIIMMHRGRVVHDFRGAEKRRLRPEDLIDRFDEIRRREQLDESAAAMLRELYV